MVVFGVIDCVMRLLVSSCSFAPSQSQNVLVLFPVCVLFFFSFFRHRLFNIRVSFHYANGLCCRNQDLIGSHLHLTHRPRPRRHYAKPLHSSRRAIGTARDRSQKSLSVGNHRKCKISCHLATALVVREVFPAPVPHGSGFCGVRF